MISLREQTVTNNMEASFVSSIFERGMANKVSSQVCPHQFPSSRAVQMSSLCMARSIRL